MSLDWMPFASQGKAAFQLVCGDVKGAKKTTKNFLQECPGVSQLTSTVQLVSGDKEGAVETQKRCLKVVNNLADAFPPTGYPKGIVHYALGDKEGGHRAMRSATRSTAVMAATAATGGSAAIVAPLTAIGTSLAYDTVESAIFDENQGHIKKIEDALEDPSAGSLFEAVYGIGNPVFKAPFQGGGTRVYPEYEFEDSSTD